MPEKHQAPDGGWGWVVVIAFAISNIIVIPVLQGFALIFRHVFEELQFSAADISVIINVNSAFGLILGLLNAPFLKRYGFRKVAIVGSIVLFIGILLTSLASSFTQFIIYYGIINSIGFSIVMSAYNLALNTYFCRRRNIASGVCTTVTGLGPVFMPLLVSFLLNMYGVRGTALILSGLTLHAFVGSLLLHPVEWHLKPPTIENGLKEKELELLNPPVTLMTNQKSAPTKEENDNVWTEENGEEEEDVVEDYDIHSMHGLEDSMVPTRVSETGRGSSIISSRLSLNDKMVSPESTWWRTSRNAHRRRLSSRISTVSKPEKLEKKKTPSWRKKLIELFDLDLLKDPGYRTIWLGMSLAFTGEINFSLMTPVILGDRGFSIEDTARLMSGLAIADILFRFISPFVGDAMKLPAKQMYMMSLVLLVVTRFGLTLVSGYLQTMMSCLLIGVAKGFRTVYMNLVIPNYVPLEKLASASGLQTLLNGILLIVFGPIIGLVRDMSGSYDYCIYIINIFSLITIIMWSYELLIEYRIAKKEEKQVISH